MLKLFNEFAKSLFAEEAKASLPDFKHKKSLRGPLAGGANFEFKVDAARSGWICFGGFKESSFTVMAAWTVSGLGLRSLPEWEQYGNPNAFKVPPVPADGYVDLRDRWRFERPESGGTYYNLDMGEPPVDFARSVYEAYIQSPEFEADVQRTYQGALRLYTKNPPTMEEQRTQSLGVEWTYCRMLWSHLATRHTFLEPELETLLRPSVSKAMDLVHRHGHPLIRRQLCLDSV